MGRRGWVGVIWPSTPKEPWRFHAVVVAIMKIVGLLDFWFLNLIYSKTLFDTPTTGICMSWFRRLEMAQTPKSSDILGNRDFLANCMCKCDFFRLLMCLKGC